MSLTRKREDATQKLFEKFMEEKGNHTPFAYSANKIVVLTTDPKLYKILLSFEKQKLINTFKKDKKDIYKIVKLQELGLGRDELSSQIEIKSYYKNALYFEEQSASDGLTDAEMGGYLTLIIGEDIEQLKEYIPYVINRHIEECHICLDTKNLIFNDLRAPYIIINISVNNENLALSSEFFSTRNEIKNAHSTIISKIDEITYNEDSK